MTTGKQDLCQKWLDLPNDELNASTINDVLSAMLDDLWVVTAVADRIVDNPTTLYDLVGVAIQRSEGTVERLRHSFSLQDCQDGGQDSSSVDASDDLVSYFRENPSDARICLLRSVLLDRKDRADTFVEMFGKSVSAEGESEPPADWDDDPWLDTGDAETGQRPSETAPPLSLFTFLSQSLVDSARLLAARESLNPLQVLLKRHGTSIWPHRFTILECIPAHVSPSYYEQLLPKLDLSRDEEYRSPVEIWRTELDWTEYASVQAALSTAGYHVPQSQQPSIPSTYGAPLPLSSGDLASWYRQRIQSILDSTGMVDVALSMAQHATSQGIVGLDELGEELSLFSRLVYDAQAAAEDGPEDDWTLDQWKSMDSLSVVRAMLALSTPETLVADIRKFVLPYLLVLESRAERAGDPNPNSSLQLLIDFFLGAPLEMVARIFEESKPTLPSSQRLITDSEDMARLALACLYGSDSTDEWDIMSRIFECLPAWNGASGDENSNGVEMTVTSLGTYVTPTTTRPNCTPSDLFLFFRPLPLPSLSRALDILDAHLESGEILSRWDSPAPLRWFLQSSTDKSSQRARAVRMARRIGANRAAHSQDDWEWLLEDMLKLCRTNDNGQQSAFGLLSRTDILSIFLSGLLSTGRKFLFPFHSRAFE